MSFGFKHFASEKINSRTNLVRKQVLQRHNLLPPQKHIICYLQKNVSNINMIIQLQTNNEVLHA